MIFSSLLKVRPWNGKTRLRVYALHSTVAEEVPHIDIEIIKDPNRNWLATVPVDKTVTFASHAVHDFCSLALWPLRREDPTGLKFEEDVATRDLMVRAESMASW